MFRPDTTRPPLTHDGSPLVYPAGAANGALRAAVSDASAQIKIALEAIGLKSK